MILEICVAVLVFSLSLLKMYFPISLKLMDISQIICLYSFVVSSPSLPPRFILPGGRLRQSFSNRFALRKLLCEPLVRCSRAAAAAGERGRSEASRFVRALT